jgi:hypothetical protein
MYYGLFACTIYDSHGVDLYTIYDSHSVYLCVLCTICMYKFSRCHAVIFYVFSFPMPDFWIIRPIFYIIHPEIAMLIFLDKSANYR